jgi:hypothetical protein
MGARRTGPFPRALFETRLLLGVEAQVRVEYCCVDSPRELITGSSRAWCGREIAG